MMLDSLRYCPVCATPLVRRTIADIERLICPDEACGHIFWDNPIPVVAALVEHEGQLVFARNVKWPHGMYGLITGFLEPREDPADGVVREVSEELGINAEIRTFIGAYNYARKNQLLLAYHLIGNGKITLNEELDEWFHVAKADAEYWPGGTGQAVRDWLRSQGYSPRQRVLPPEVEAWRQRPPEPD